MLFQRLSLLFTIGLTSLILLGCTSTEVTSNKKASFTQELDSLYITSTISESLDSYESSALITFARTLSAQDIKVQTFAIPESDEAEDAEEETTDGPDDAASEESTQATKSMEMARKQGARYLLMLEERDQDKKRYNNPPMMGAGGMMFGGGGVKKKYYLNASLYDLTTESRVWRAEISTKGEEYSTQGKEGRVMAESVLAKLVEDGLLPASFSTNSRKF